MGRIMFSKVRAPNQHPARQLDALTRAGPTPAASHALLLQAP